MNKAIKIFENYLDNFDMNDDGIKLKYEHTFRVTKYAKEIAKSLNLNDEDIDLACQCALFHDIARFKQWRDYNTFYDNISFDHGDEGYNILKELNVKNEIILLSTKYHNKYAVGDVDDKTLMFCNIVRDADKIDIMLTQNKECNDEEYIVDESIIESIKNNKLMNNKLVHTKRSDVNKLLRCITFIFDINYKKSMQIIKNSNEINNKFDIILNKFNKEEIIKLKYICNKYIDERLGN